MDPAEEITSIWLQQQGFFVKNHVKVGYSGKEIDFLVIDPRRDLHVHVEVRVAVIPLGLFRPWGPAKYSRLSLTERVKLYYEDKFLGVVSKKDRRLKNECVKQKASGMFDGHDYEKWLVLGVLHEKEDRYQLVEEFKKHGVKVFFIENLLKEIRFEGGCKRFNRTVHPIAGSSID